MAAARFRTIFWKPVRPLGRRMPFHLEPPHKMTKDSDNRGQWETAAAIIPTRPEEGLLH